MWLLGIEMTAMRRSFNEARVNQYEPSTMQTDRLAIDLIRSPIHPSRLLTVMKVAFGAPCLIRKEASGRTRRNGSADRGRLSVRRGQSTADGGACRVRKRAIWGCSKRSRQQPWRRHRWQSDERRIRPRSGKVPFNGIRYLPRVSGA